MGNVGTQLNYNTKDEVPSEQYKVPGEKGEIIRGPGIRSGLTKEMVLGGF